MLLVDLDETLVKVFPDERIREAPWVFHLDRRPFSCFFRPDIGILAGVPIGIFTAGDREYAHAVVAGLRRLGLKIGLVKHRGHIAPSAPILSVPRGVLIDESAEIAAQKMKKLRGFRWLQVRPFDKQASYRTSQGELLRLDIAKSPGMSLRRCLEQATLLGALGDQRAAVRS